MRSSRKPPDWRSQSCGVVAAARQQLGVGPGFDDSARVDHDQAVHPRDRREPVRDCEHGAAAHQRVELFLDRRFGFGVERGGRFVEHQDRGVFEDHARERDALPLTAGELHAALADLRVESAPALPILERLDELDRMGAARRFAHLGVGRLGPPVADVLADRSGAGARCPA